MFIKLLQVLIALSMLLISIGTWRYQGDIHHLKKSLFQITHPQPQARYQALWERYSDKETPMTIKPLHFWSFLARWHQPNTPLHPSEKIMDRIIHDPQWQPNIPNSNSSTYPFSQKIWMSQNLTIEELLSYLMDHNLSVASPPLSERHSIPDR